MTTFADQLYQMGGVPVGGLFTPGRAIFVRPGTGSDANDGKKPNRAVATLAKALSLATADKGDVVYLIAEGNSAAATTDYQSTALDWNKDGVHLVGIGANPLIGKRSRIAQLSTVKTIEDLVTVSANNCIIKNIAIFQGVASSTATSPRALVVSGQRNVFIDCDIQGNGDTGGSTDTAGARSLAVTGAENSFINCYLGLDTVIRATQTCEIDCANARNVFDKCVVNSYTSLSTFKALTTTSSSTGRDIILRDTMISAVLNITSAVAPTGAIAHAQSGSVLMHNSGVYGYADVASSDNTYIKVLAPISTVDSGVAKLVDIA